MPEASARADHSPDSRAAALTGPPPHTQRLATDLQTNQTQLCGHTSLQGGSHRREGGAERIPTGRENITIVGCDDIPKDSIVERNSLGGVRRTLPQPSGTLHIGEEESNYARRENPIDRQPPSTANLITEPSKESYIRHRRRVFRWATFSPDRSKPSSDVSDSAANAIANATGDITGHGKTQAATGQGPIPYRSTLFDITGY